MRAYLGGIAIIVALGACSHGTVAMRAPAAPGPRLTFFVRAAGRVPLENLSGVSLVGIRADGARIDFGRSFDGKLTVEKSRIRSEQIQLLIFCLEGFHCSAYDLQAEVGRREHLALLDFDEWNIDLAPFVLYD